MLNSFKYFILIGLATCVCQNLSAQVRLNLSLLPDHQTYLVSMIPEHSWDAPLNMVGSAQIVLQFHVGKLFLAGQIKSLIPGVTWTDNAYIESPASASEYNFACFALNELGTKNIPFQANVETPLFTFVNLEPECVGVLELVDNNSSIIQNIVNTDRLNVTQNITVLGARGNAVTGIENGSADCAALYIKGTKTIVHNLHIYPVPATDVLHIFWENHAAGRASKLLVSDMLGRLVTQEKTSENIGEQHIELDVATYPTGLYMASFFNEVGDRQSFRFVVIRL